MKCVLTDLECINQTLHTTQHIVRILKNLMEFGLVHESLEDSYEFSLVRKSLTYVQYSSEELVRIHESPGEDHAIRGVRESSKIVRESSEEFA